MFPEDHLPQFLWRQKVKGPFIQAVETIGVQYASPQKYATLPLFWIKSTWEIVQEVHSAPSMPLKEEINLPCGQSPPCTRRVEGILITRNREFRAERAISTISLLLHQFTTPSANPFVLSIFHRFIVSFSKRYKSFLIWSLLWVSYFYGAPVHTKLNLFFSW